MNDDQLLKLFLQSAREAMAERPQIGVRHRHEWATVGRLGIWLARKPQIVELEKKGIFLDIEYGQMSSEDMKSTGDGDVRIDMILHRRGTNEDNLLACEVKMSPRKARKVDGKDDGKLRALTTKRFGYRLGIWIRFPRNSEDRHTGRYAIYRNGEPEGLLDL